MRRAELRVDEVVYGTAIAAHAKTSHLEEAVGLLRSMKPATAVAYTAVIAGFARLGAR